jgi:carbon storage regulator
MLVLSRKAGEKILIGDDIVVTVLDVHSTGRVSVGIKAPNDMVVDRLEVHNLKTQQATNDQR